MGVRGAVSDRMASWMMAAIAPAVIFIATAIDRSYQTDFWHHLARGRAIVTEGRIVDEDQFTYTVPGQPMHETNWLTQLLYAVLYRYGGLELAQLANSLAFAAMMCLLVAQCQRWCGSLSLAAAVCLFAFLGLWRLLLIRPQTFSLLYFALLYTILDLADHRRGLLLLPPVVFALWANMHRAFPIGFVLLGCFVLAALWEAVRSRGRAFFREPRPWALAACLAASILATLANPYGWRIYEYLVTTSNRASARSIQEWLPPGLNLFVGQMWVLSVVVVIAALALPARRPTFREVTLIVVFLAFACGAIRMVAWWWIVVTPILAGQLAASLPKTWLANPAPQRTTLTTPILALVLVFLVVSSIPGLDRFFPWQRLYVPAQRTEDELEEVAKHLRMSPGKHRRVFSKLEWGEYLGWTLAPDGYTIFMDGRMELYPDEVWHEYMALMHGRWDCLDILDRYEVDFLVLDANYPEHRDNLLPLVRKSGKWKEDPFRSGNAMVFVRGGKTP